MIVSSATPEYRCGDATSDEEMAVVDKALVRHRV